MADVGRLVVQLSANVSRLQRDMNRATTVVRGATQRITRLGGIATSAIGALGAGIGALSFVNAIRGTIDLVDQMEALRNKTGLTVETLSGLKFAAEQSDTQFSTFIRGIQRLNKTLADADRGLKTAQDALAGVASRDTLGALFEIADQIQATGINAQTSARLMEIFGRTAGPELAPLLSLGAEGVRALIQENEALGGLITTDTANAISDYKDNINALQVAFRGVTQEIVDDLSPALVGITEAMREAARETGLLQAIWVGLGGVGAAIFTDTFVNPAEKARRKIAELRAEQERLSGTVRGGASGRRRANARLQEIEREIAAEEQRISALQASAAAEEQLAQRKREAQVQAREAAAALAEEERAREAAEAARARAAEAALRAAQSRADSLRATLRTAEQDVALQIREIQELIRTTDLTQAEGEQLTFRLYTDLQAANDQAALERTLAKQQELDRIQARFNSEFATAADLATERLREYEQLVQAGIISQERWNQAAVEIFDTLSDEGLPGAEAIEAQTSGLNDAARDLGLTFSSAFEQATLQGESFRGVLDAIFQDIARIALRKLVTEPLANIFSGLFQNIGSGLGGFTNLLGLPSGLAQGGPAYAGTPYIVGEAGPELFVPRQSGQVVPNDQLASMAGGQAVNITVNVASGTPGDVRRAAGAGAREAVGALGRAQRYA